MNFSSSLRVQCEGACALPTLLRAWSVHSTDAVVWTDLETRDKLCMCPRPWATSPPQIQGPAVSEVSESVVWHMLDMTFKAKSK